METPSIPYQEPSWSKPPANDFSFEVLKEGKIISNISLSDPPTKTFYVIGRAPICDIPLEHTSVSRFHAVIQHSGRKGEVFLRDLDSTHGTKINKQKAPPQRYISLRQGYVVKFGESTRLFILNSQCEFEELPTKVGEEEVETKGVTTTRATKNNGREEGVEREEVDRTAVANGGRTKEGEEQQVFTGTMEEMADFLKKNRRMIQGKELDSNFEKTAAEARGLASRKQRTKADLIQAIEKGDLTTFRAGISQDAQNDAKWVKGLQRNTAKGGRKGGKGGKGGSREEEEEEEEDSLDAVFSNREMDEEEKKEADRQKMLKAYFEEEDREDSDEDEFFDRTQGKKKRRGSDDEDEGSRQGRKNNKKRRGEREVETYESLSGKLEKVKGEVSSLLSQLEAEKKGKGKNSRGEGDDGDSLDAFMNSISTGLEKEKLSKLEKELEEKRKEEARFQRLVEITRPAMLSFQPSPSPPLMSPPSLPTRPPTSSPSSTPSSMPPPALVKSTHTAPFPSSLFAIPTLPKRSPGKTSSCSPSLFDEETVESKRKVQLTKLDEEEDTSVSSSPPGASSTSASHSSSTSTSTSSPSSTSLRSRKEALEQAKLRRKKFEEMNAAKNKSTPTYGLQKGTSPSTSSLPSSTEKGKRKGQARAEGESEESEVWEDPETYVEFVPPQGQSGDGKTNLNRRFGY